MGFGFHSARIAFGCGELSRLGELVRGLGGCFLVVSDGRSPFLLGVVERIEAQLSSVGARCARFTGVYREPDPEIVDAALAAALAAGAEAVIGVGGGSCIDTAKTVAGLIPNGGPVVDYLEGVGSGRKLTRDPVPFVAIPTTAGTGAEVTKNAVISSHVEHYKKSFRDDRLMARLALVDPELTLGLPPEQTAASGMDALTQCIECYLSRNANPITDGLALEGMALGARSLLTCYRQGNDLEAREDLCACSLMSGMALANSRLGAVHGLGQSLGARLGVGHGLSCAVLLPHVMRLNHPACPERMARVGIALTGVDRADGEANARAAVDFIWGLNAQMGIPQDLKFLNIDPALLPELARGSRGNSMSGNPVQLDDAGWEQFLRALI